jgi:hypothetical protein
MSQIFKTVLNNFYKIVFGNVVSYSTLNIPDQFVISRCLEYRVTEKVTLEETRKE